MKTIYYILFSLVSTSAFCQNTLLDSICKPMCEKVVTLNDTSKNYNRIQLDLFIIIHTELEKNIERKTSLIKNIRSKYPDLSEKDIELNTVLEIEDYLFDNCSEFQITLKYLYADKDYDEIIETKTLKLIKDELEKYCIKNNITDVNLMIKFIYEFMRSKSHDNYQNFILSDVDPYLIKFSNIYLRAVMKFRTERNDPFISYRKK